MSRKPPTEKQQEASRINGRKSQGPNTPRGKSVSSRNAIKHGFLSQSVLLLGESPDRFLALKHAYLREFLPQNQREFDLIDNLAVNRWRLLRNWTLESVSLNYEQRQQAEGTGVADPPTQAMMAMRALQNPPRSQEGLSRHEVRLDRQYYKALDRLERLIEKRVARDLVASQSEKEERRTGDLVACHPENEKNEKSQKRPWEVIENTNRSATTQPGKRPAEPHQTPKQDPTNPEENPKAA